MLDSVTPWTVAHQVPLSMGFSRQEYWSRLPFLTAGDFPDSRIEPTSLASPALAGRFFTTAPPGNPCLTPSLILILFLGGEGLTDKESAFRELII